MDGNGTGTGGSGAGPGREAPRCTAARPFVRPARREQSGPRGWRYRYHPAAAAAPGESGPVRGGRARSSAGLPVRTGEAWLRSPRGRGGTGPLPSHPARGEGVPAPRCPPPPPAPLPQRRGPAGYRGCPRSPPPTLRCGSPRRARLPLAAGCSPAPTFPSPFSRLRGGTAGSCHPGAACRLVTALRAALTRWFRPVRRWFLGHR